MKAQIRRGPYLGGKGSLIGRVSDGLRQSAAHLAQEMFPRVRKRYPVASFALSRSRNHGWPFAEAAELMRASGPEGAQKAAAWFQCIADSTATEEALCIDRLNREAIRANASDLIATSEWTPGCQESDAQLVAAKLADMAVDRMVVVALTGRYA